HGRARPGSRAPRPPWPPTVAVARPDGPKRSQDRLHSSRFTGQCGRPASRDRYERPPPTPALDLVYFCTHEWGWEGHAGADARRGREIRPPLWCDYGYQTFVGARCFATWGA